MFYTAGFDVQSIRALISSLPGLRAASAILIFKNKLGEIKAACTVLDNWVTFSRVQMSCRHAPATTLQQNKNT